ncbi:hypothetical protein [Sinorhizobium sp. RAC02]|uniref:hypothetical protein n=1 Tax=Sinorhizobium sp. RAC02 TaxID=1842534 RepID=UPI000855F8A9|nr:hypothetical protein [Sinorhizobium sp. RAC02]AOF90052.1 hypothetical protein BSY16_2008 [Sinorhizobium sp. RAC02]
MQMDAVERAREIIASGQSLREKQLANRAEIQRKVQAAAKPLYVLKSKKQLELRLQ